MLEAKLQTDTSQPNVSLKAKLPFEPGKHYPPKAVAAEEIAAEQTLAQWRHLKKGPPYIKVGARVLYRGSDLLDWLAKNRVETEAA